VLSFNDKQGKKRMQKNEWIKEGKKEEKKKNRKIKKKRQKKQIKRKNSRKFDGFKWLYRKEIFG